MFEISFCCLCGRPTADWRVCQQCAGPLEHIWPCFAHEGVCAKVIYAFKFERARAAAQILAAQLDAQLPYLPDWHVVPLPTAPSRVRQRGYDQAVLLAKAFARLRQLPYSPILGRLTDGRQIGSSRAVRTRQATQMFYLKRKEIKTNILLVDDVCTTGASLQAAAALLKQAGAAHVAAGVVAWKQKR